MFFFQCPFLFLWNHQISVTRPGLSQVSSSLTALATTPLAFRTFRDDRNKKKNWGLKFWQPKWGSFTINDDLMGFHWYKKWDLSWVCGFNCSLYFFNVIYATAVFIYIYMCFFKGICKQQYHKLIKVMFSPRGTKKSWRQIALVLCGIFRTDNMMPLGCVKIYWSSGVPLKTTESACEKMWLTRKRLAPIDNQEDNIFTDKTIHRKDCLFKAQMLVY